MLAYLELAPDDEVLDVGCGKATMLIWLIERFGVHGVGIDRNDSFLAEARASADGRIPSGSLELHARDVADMPLEPGCFAAALCVGSTHAYGGYRPTLRALRDVVRHRGRVVIGEGYWRREPASGYLAAIGAKPDELGSHAENQAIACQEGLRVLEAVETNEDDWEEYEGSYARSVERYILDHAGDPDTREMSERIRAWRDAYLRWGRETLGFALYLLEAP